MTSPDAQRFGLFAEHQHTFPDANLGTSRNILSYGAEDPNADAAIAQASGAGGTDDLVDMARRVMLMPTGESPIRLLPPVVTDIPHE